MTRRTPAGSDFSRLHCGERSAQSATQPEPELYSLPFTRRPLRKPPPLCRLRNRWNWPRKSLSENVLRSACISDMSRSRIFLPGKTKNEPCGPSENSGIKNLKIEVTPDKTPFTCSVRGYFSEFLISSIYGYLFFLSNPAAIPPDPSALLHLSVNICSCL